MMNINDLTDRKHPLNILCLGAHCDDIEIGCCARDCASGMIVAGCLAIRR